MATFPQLQSNMDPDEIDKTLRGGPTLPHTPGPGGPGVGLGFGGGYPGSQIGRNPALTMFSPQRKLFGQAWGGKAGRSAPSTAAKFSGAGGGVPMSAATPGAGGIRSTALNALGNLRPAGSPGGLNSPQAPPPTNPYPPGTPEYELFKQYSSNINTKPGAYSGNTGALSAEAVRQMIASGMLNPGGSQPMIDALYGQARGDADALRARSNTMSQLSGMDPAQAASSYFQRDMGTEGEIQRMLLNARLQSMTQNRQLLESIGTSGMNAAYQNWLSNNNFKRNASL